MSYLATLPRDRRCEIVGVLLLGVALFLFLALATDGYAGSIQRPMPSSMAEAQNALGVPGAWVASVLTILFGRAAHLLYFMLGVWGLMLFRHRPIDRIPTRIVGLILMCCALSGMCHIDFAGKSDVLPGGVIGLFAGSTLVSGFGRLPANVVGATMAIIGLLLATEFLFVRMVNQFRLLAMLLVGGAIVLMRMAFKAWRGSREAKPRLRRRRGLGEIADEEELLASEAESDAEESSEWDEYAAESAGEEYDPELEPEFSSPNIRTAPPEPPFVDPFFAQEAEEEFALEPAVESPEEPAVARAPEAKKAAPGMDAKSRKNIQLRRKALIDEELPDDYIYPRRYAKPSLDIFDPAPIKERPELGDQLRKTSQLL